MSDSYVFRKTGATAITDGGEGTIYDIGNDVVKIYKSCVDIKAKERKINLLLQKSLPSEVVGPIQPAVNSRGKFVGYVMHKIDGKDFKNLSTKKFVKSNNITLKDELSMLINIKSVMNTLHSQGIYIGDFNDQNILFDQNFNVYFIDVDSWSIGDEHCTVAMDLFRDPKLVGDNFNAETDTYSFCVLAWKTITRIHPFGGTMNPDIKIMDRISKGISVIDRPNVIIPRTINSWKNLSPNLITMFKNVFENGQRTIGDELEEMNDNLKFCKIDSIYYFGKYTNCPICDANAKVVTKPISQGTVSGLTLVSMLDVSKVGTVISNRIYIDTNGDIIDLKTGNKTKFIHGLKFYFTDNGAIITDYSSKFTISTSRGDYTFDKRFKSEISVQSNDIYYMNNNSSLCKVTVFDSGNSIDKITQCCINSYFDIYKDNYCVVNIDDGNLIINSNGYNCEIPYNESVISYGIHFDPIYNSWLIVLENKSGRFDTFVISGTNCIFKTDKITYQCALSNLCMYNGTIFIPIDGKIRGYNFRKDVFKDFECGIVSPDSKLIKRDKKFIIVNDDNIYTLG